ASSAGRPCSPGPGGPGQRPPTGRLGWTCPTRANPPRSVVGSLELLGGSRRARRGALHATKRWKQHPTAPTSAAATPAAGSRKSPPLALRRGLAPAGARGDGERAATRASPRLG